MGLDLELFLGQPRDRREALLASLVLVHATFLVFFAAAAWTRIVAANLLDAAAGAEARDHLLGFVLGQQAQERNRERAEDRLGEAKQAVLGRGRTQVDT